MTTMIMMTTMMMMSRQESKKKEDGETTYVAFVKKSLEVLSYGGFLNLIIPNLRLKPDKSGLYNKLTNLSLPNNSNSIYL